MYFLSFPSKIVFSYYTPSITSSFLLESSLRVIKAWIYGTSVHFPGTSKTRLADSLEINGAIN